jgi:hypothetical protein
MFIYPGPIGYDEETGNCYVNPESVDAILIGWLKKGLSAEEAYKQWGRRMLLGVGERD